MLINFYGHFGDVQSALDIFNNLRTSDQGADSVSNMMRAMLQNGWNEQVLLLYGMHSTLPNADSLHSHALKACVNLKNHDYGLRICQKLKSLKKGPSPRMRSAMIGFYGDIGDMESARNLVDLGNVFNIGVMMKMYLRNHQYRAVLDLYDAAVGVIPPVIPANDQISHLHALKACIGSGDEQKGKAIHHRVSEAVGEMMNVQMKTALIEFYASFGDMERAIDLFVSVDQRQKDGQLVAVMMKALMDHDGSDEAMERALKLYDVYWSNENATHVLALKCCMALNDVVRGSKIERALKPKEEGNLHLINTLIDYHGHFGNVHKAEEVLCVVRE